MVDTVSLSRILFLAAGSYTLACIPGILIAESLGQPQSFFHATQFVAVCACFAAALMYLRNGPKARSRGRTLAWTAAALSGAWLAFVAYVLFTIDFSVID